MHGVSLCGDLVLSLINSRLRPNSSRGVGLSLGLLDPEVIKTSPLCQAASFLCTRSNHLASNEVCVISFDWWQYGSCLSPRESPGNVHFARGIYGKRCTTVAMPSPWQAFPHFDTKVHFYNLEYQICCCAMRVWIIDPLTPLSTFEAHVCALKCPQLGWQA